MTRQLPVCRWCGDGFRRATPDQVTCGPQCRRLYRNTKNRHATNRKRFLAQDLPSPGCATPLKDRYPFRGDAARADQLRQRRYGGKPQRPYWCAAHQAWHLTTRPLREAA